MQSALLPIAILSGGLGTRLMPITASIPKALVKINAKEFILWQVELLKQHNFKKIIFCLQHLSEQIVTTIEQANIRDIDIQYSFDGDTTIGTAGAIKKALPLLGDNFFVMYGDSYLLCPYQEIQAAFFVQHKLGLMTMFHNQNTLDRSNVHFENNGIVKYDKKSPTDQMQHIDYGLSVFNKDAFASTPTGTFTDLSNVHQQLLANTQLSAFLVQERFYEIGSINGIQLLEEHFNTKASV